MSDATKRETLLARVNNVLVQVTLSANGGTANLEPTYTHSKPESSTPNFSIVQASRSLMADLDDWLRYAENSLELNDDLELMARWHAAIVAAADWQLEKLIVALGLTEARMHITWSQESRSHRARRSESESARRDRYETMILTRYHGVGTEAVAKAEGVTKHEIETIRLKHGIYGRNGRRVKQCEEMLLKRATKRACAVCAIVDDLDQQSRTKTKGAEAA